MGCDGPDPRQVLVGNDHDVEWHMRAGRCRATQMRPHITLFIAPLHSLQRRLGLRRPLPLTARARQCFQTALRLRLRVVICIDHHVGPMLPAPSQSTTLNTQNARTALGLRLRPAPP
jgi:hypothetical protein